MVCGLSNKLTADEQGKLTGDAWERLPEPRPRLMLVVVGQDGTRHEYLLGPHRPRVRQEDVDLLHSLWKEATSDPKFRELHHYHVLNVALQEMERRMHNGAQREEVMRDLEERDVPPLRPHPARRRFAVSTERMSVPDVATEWLASSALANIKV